MSLDTRFRLGANKLIDKFAVGEMVLQRVTGSAYNTTTGIRTITGPKYKIPGALDEIEVEKYGTSYAIANFVCILDGISLNGVVPKVGDLITIPEGTTHKVVRKLNDQYHAAFFLHLSKQPV